MKPKPAPDSPDQKTEHTDIDAIALSPGAHVNFDPTKNIDIHRDDLPPSSIEESPDGFIVTWDDGFYVVLTPESGLDQPRQVSINSATFDMLPAVGAGPNGSDSDAAVPDYLQWVAAHTDNPLPFAPLPPYNIGLPSEEIYLAKLLPTETTTSPTTTSTTLLVAPTVILPSAPPPSCRPPLVLRGRRLR